MSKYNSFSKIRAFAFHSVNIITRRSLVTLIFILLLITSFLILNNLIFDQSAKKFEFVRVGMTSALVTKTLGEPITKFKYYDEHSNVQEIWSYNRSPLGFSYERRWVVFNNGRVTRIEKQTASD